MIGLEFCQKKNDQSENFGEKRTSAAAETPENRRLQLHQCICWMYVNRSLENLKDSAAEASRRALDHLNGKNEETKQATKETSAAAKHKAEDTTEAAKVSRL